jgi:hypothetical protein
MIPQGKKWMCLLIVAWILVLLSGRVVHAQENWVYTYDGPGNRDDRANGVVYGADGNIYVAGRDYVTASDSRFVVMSLTPAGDTNWVNVYNGPYTNGADEAYSVVYGKDNYLYAAGYSVGSGNDDDDFIVAKYDTLGNQLWLNRYNGPGDDDDVAYSIVYGDDNYVYAAGYSKINSAPLDRDFVVIKYRTSDGNRQWVYRYLCINLDDEAYSVVYGTDGNIYAAGYTKQSLNNKNFLVVKLNTSGTEQWTYLRNGPGNGDDEAKQLFYKENSVYAAGYSTGSGTGKDFTIVSLNPTTGDSNWVYTWNGPGNGDDEANSIAVWGAGMSVCAVVAGYSTGSGTSKDFAVLYINSYNGTLHWSYLYNGLGNGDDEAKAVVLNSSDWHFYVGGYSTGSGTDKDFIVTKHGHSHSSGSPQWMYQYNGPGNNNDELNTISLGSGNIYAAGYSRVSGSYSDFAVLSLPDNFPPTVPLLISPADSAFLNDTAVTFIWHASEDPETSVDNYVLHYDIDPNFTNPESAVVGDTSYTVTLNDTIYYWRIKSCDTEDNQSSWSDVWSFAFDLTPPTIPVLLHPVDDNFVLDTSVTFDWGDVTFRDFPTLVHYVIQIDSDSSFSVPIIDDTMTQSTANYVLAGDDQYYWRVKAYDLALNESDYAIAESFRLDISPPVIDSTSDWENTPNTGPFSVYTRVTDLFGVDSVLLYFKRMEDPVWFPLQMHEGSGNLYFEEIPGVGMPNDTVKYYIHATDNAGYTSTDPDDAPTAYYWFIAGYDPGVMEFNTPPVFSFGLKNNPAKSKAVFNLALPEAADVTLRIYDAAGRLVDKVIFGKQAPGYYEIQWSKDVSSGIFFYHLDSPWQQKIGKLVLVK